ncbi:MAG: hypothetical protein QXZ20_01985 [Candidatus Aenigmatarchaeota archaeon]
MSKDNKSQKIITSKKVIKSIVYKVLEKNPQDIIDYKKGIEGALDRLVGKVFKESKGRVDPVIIRMVLKEILK